MTNETTTAATYDDGKPPLALLPGDALCEVAKVLAYGANKYGAEGGTDNWRKGMEWRRHASCALRHIYKWLGGQTIDPETGCHHLAHAAARLMFLLSYHFENTGIDDRYTTTSCTKG